MCGNSARDQILAEGCRSPIYAFGRLLIRCGVCMTVLLLTRRGRGLLTPLCGLRDVSVGTRAERGLGRRYSGLSSVQIIDVRLGVKSEAVSSALRPAYGALDPFALHSTFRF